MNRRNDATGFTLVELLVVVTILGILAAIAITVFLEQREKAANAAAKSDLRNLVTAEIAYLSENGGYTDDPEELPEGEFKQTDSVTLQICTYESREQFIAVAQDSLSDTPFYYSSETQQISEAPPVGCDPTA